MYEVSEDTNLYSDMDGKDAFDKLDKGSVVTILEEAETDFIRVDYNGNEGYVRVSLLKDI
ncbi:SH3 domain-containing protein [uncultured Anaerococcus sp.]|uniref:SH3 domain-containing protein n=1 Tax=uncultured Anaerococcus sp. TaxID=293428 RepID=UPI00262B73C1|nr:SH3 domain-containing protein [uncultured Anaerococcus sp.]